MRERTQEEIIAALEKTVKMYERVFELSTQELQQAYNTIEAHEAVEDLSRDELLNLKEEVKEVRHFSNLRTRFFSNISHEIRTPLTLLIAPLESMLQGELGDVSEEQRSYLQLMYENAQRLLKMVNELLDFSKLEAGKMKLFYQEEDVCALVNTVLETFIPYAEKTGIRFETKIPSDPVLLFIDAEKVEKVIINLVFNAFKYVAEKGVVRVTLEESKKNAKFTVFNTGEGLPAEVLSQVFDRYAQFENYSRDKKPQGTGLGLALSKEFISLHKGTIRMKSKPGQGINCEFTLPKGTDHIDKDLLALGWGELERRKGVDGKPTRPLPTKGASSLYTEISGFYFLKRSDLHRFEETIKRTTNAQKLYLEEDRKKVLIVEDNNEMRGFLRYVLANYFDIYDAVDGQDGFEKATRLQPDLIISDVMMPNRNGYEMTKLLKAQDATCRIPIILLTARANNLNAMIEGLNIGADDYVSKPFNIKELIARANALLRMEALYDQLESTEGVIFSLANAVEAKDSYTEGHCYRLAELSMEMGRRLGMEPDRLQVVKNGAILHDVGKIGVPEAILTKPGHLTEEEREIIKQHPLIGERICKPLKYTINILPIIRSHHERFDGGGYPDGLAGDKIALEARIVAVADSFDAMVYDRVYRKGIGITRARTIFKDERNAGQWDPELVDVFLNIDEDWLEKCMSRRNGKTLQKPGTTTA